jgi:hypothetical protein
MRLTSADFVSPGETLDPNAYMDPRDIADLRRLAGLPVIGEDVNSQMGLQNSSQQNPMAPAGDNPWGIKSPVGTTGGNLDKRKIEKEKNLVPGTDEWFRLWFSQKDNLTADDFEKNEKLGMDEIHNTLMSKPTDPTDAGGSTNEAVDPAIVKKRKKRQDVNHGIYVITNIITGEQYIGITAGRPNLKKALWVRMQKHAAQRARVEEKDWGLCKSIREYGPEAFTYGLLEVVRGKKPAHARETELIKQYNPSLNTFR